MSAGLKLKVEMMKMIAEKGAKEEEDKITTPQYMAAG